MIYFFSESKDNEGEISDIMEQLNLTAEKLTRLNAVKDLKLLQVIIFYLLPNSWGGNQKIRLLVLKFGGFSKLLRKLAGENNELELIFIIPLLN